MGRKDKFTVDYFPHNCNHGKTVFILESRFGNIGYAVWFKTLELLGTSNNHFIDCRNTSDWEFMSAKMQVEPDRLQQIYNLLATLEAIDQDLWKHKIIWSQNFIDNLEDVYIRRKKKCMDKDSLCKHLLIKCKHESVNSEIDVSIKPQTKLKQTKLKKTKYGEYNHVLLKSEELKKLKVKFPNWEWHIKNLDEAIQQHGYKYKDHYLTIFKWDRDKKENPQKSKREIVGYQYDCYHCGKIYDKEKSGTYRCTENDCQIEMRGEEKKQEIVGAKLDLIKILDKK